MSIESSFETPYSEVIPTPPTPEIEIEGAFQSFVPLEFIEDPFGYFEKFGQNIKSGQKIYDADGVVKEDPTATKDLPLWRNSDGEVLQTVGKRVNTTKSQVGKSNDPFYEYTIMEIAKEFDLPAPRPVAKVKLDNEHLILMKKVEGVRWTESGMKPIHESNLTETDKKNMLAQAEEMMAQLQKSYEEIGLVRTWKLKDMIFDVDIPSKTVLNVIPTDWERTKIDNKKLAEARSRKG